MGTSARAGKGLDQLMDEVEKISYHQQESKRIPLSYQQPIEEAISILQLPIAKKLHQKLDARWVSLKLLDLDDSLHRSLTTYLGEGLLDDPEISQSLLKAKEVLENAGYCEESLRDSVVSSIVAKSEAVYHQCVHLGNHSYNSRDRKIDRLLTSKATGIPIMILLLGLIFWLTIFGANYPSEMLSNLFLDPGLSGFLFYCGPCAAMAQ